MTSMGQDVEYQVVVNGEEQYSIWPTSKELPGGWSSVGVAGSKDFCLSHIEAVWVDMRPKSLRDSLARGSTADRS